MFSETRWRLIGLAGNIRFFSVFAIAFALLLLYWVSGWPRGEPQYFPGTVVSTGPVSIARLGGGTAQGVSIRLSDGRLVSVVDGHRARLLGPGDPVLVGRQEVLLGPSAYWIDEAP